MEKSGWSLLATGGATTLSSLPWPPIFVLFRQSSTKPLFQFLLRFLVLVLVPFTLCLVPAALETSPAPSSTLALPPTRFRVFVNIFAVKRVPRNVCTGIVDETVLERTFALFCIPEVQVFSFKKKRGNFVWKFTMSSIKSADLGQ